MLVRSISPIHLIYLLLFTSIILYLLYHIIYNYIYRANNPLSINRYKFKHDGYIDYIPGLTNNWPINNVINHDIFNNNSTHCTAPAHIISSFNNDLTAYHVYPLYRAGNGLSYDVSTQRYIPKGLIIYCADIGSHVAHSIQFLYSLASAGYSVHSFDYRGFGKSKGNRGEISSYRQIITQVIEFTQSVKLLHQSYNSTNSLPVFIAGSGFGACIALCATIESNRLYNGIMLLSPAIQLSSLNSLDRFIIRSTAKIVPKTSYKQLYALDQLSRNLSVALHFAADPLIYRNAYTLHTLNELLELSHATKVIIPHIKLPFIVLHGLKDLIYNPVASRQLLMNSILVPPAMKRLIGLGRCFNDLLHESEHKIVFEYCIEWLDHRVNHRKLVNSLD
jgi:alpha-beta hydrolase superfamily lysophospholipase